MQTIVERDSEYHFTTSNHNFDPNKIIVNNIPQPLDRDERILSSETDESSRLNDSMLDKYNALIIDGSQRNIPLDSGYNKYRFSEPKSIDTFLDAK